MDILLEDDIQISRAASPSERLRQALEMMETGRRWKRAALGRQHPRATDSELERMLVAWLCADD